ncbi:MAG TPA: flagellar cap protein FliD N-terminal domain-containing protein, partial [Anaerolineaceae bacterium]|nr:flagellar cap protein FliD N-terminal domain-containing protein [Anaerolineaceae bacterium]
MADNTIGQLDSVYVQLINATMKQERQPLDRITTQKDSIAIQRAIYTDLRTRLSGLKNATKTLISTDAFYALNPGRKTALSNSFVTSTGVAWSGSILTATASTSALPASYTISVNSVAKEHRVYSKQFTASDQALGLSGSFTLGGEAARSITPVTGDATIAAASATTTLGIGQKDLESGDYYIETRNDATAGWQFRVVDAKGNAVKVQLTDGSGYATDWQKIPTAPEGSTDPIAYDTGRGFKFSFGADQGLYTARSLGSGATKVSYTAQGANITISASDTLENIASKINTASYAEGQDVLATIVDRQLVLTAKQTGLAHAIKAQDGAEGILNSMEIFNGTTFTHTMQAAADASFTVNNLSVTRSSNANLT